MLNIEKINDILSIAIPNFTVLEKNKQKQHD